MKRLLRCSRPHKKKPPLVSEDPKALTMIRQTFNLSTDVIMDVTMMTETGSQLSQYHERREPSEQIKKKGNAFDRRRRRVREIEKEAKGQVLKVKETFDIVSIYISTFFLSGLLIHIYFPFFLSK
ncbi:hypothetical protein Bca52824_078865 [Brassica carinata]|uniref:Uncharacterized protein n=1 Tax=Brassica carinata TaxID=52824 RepID=A0A8X7PWV0_BRACI|nr:hypothetical protein Bca52824_078865 [Brassica carinata]